MLKKYATNSLFLFYIIYFSISLNLPSVKSKHITVIIEISSEFVIYLDEERQTAGKFHSINLRIKEKIQ